MAQTVKYYYDQPNFVEYQSIYSAFLCQGLVLQQMRFVKGNWRFLAGLGFQGNADSWYAGKANF